MKRKLEIISLILLILFGITGYSYASDKGLIGDLFEFISSGDENGNSISDEWRMDGKFIKDETVSSYEIKNGEIKNEDLGGNSVDNRVLKNDDVYTISGATITEDLIVDGKIGVGGDLDGTLTVRGAPDVTEANKVGEGGIVIENESGDNDSWKMRVDPNEIQVSNNGNPANLGINIFGGGVGIGKWPTSGLSLDVIGTGTIRGKLGIGTQSPSEKLTIEDGLLKINNNGVHTKIGSNNSSWSHFNTDAPNGFYMSTGLTVNSGKISSYDEDLILRADYNAGDTDNQLYLKTNGNIGIGTRLMNGHLTIKGATDINEANGEGEGGLVIEDSENNDNGYRIRMDANEIQVSRDGNPASLAVNQFGGNMVLGSSAYTGSQRIEIKSNGYEMLRLKDQDNDYTEDEYTSYIRGIDKNNDYVWYVGEGSSSKMVAFATYQPDYNLTLMTNNQRRLTIKDNGYVGIGTENPTERLDVDGSVNIQKTLNVLSATTIGGDINGGGSLNVDGTTHLNGNTNIGGDLVLGGTIAFEDPDDIPWLDKQTNLPFVKFGGVDYIEPQISGSFDGQIEDYFSIPHFFYEDNGALVGLRPGYNGTEKYLYYLYSEEGDYKKFTLTNMKYKPAFLRGTGNHARYIYGGNNNSIFLDTVNNNNEYQGFYLLRDINTLDPDTHTFDKVLDISSIVDDIANDYTVSYRDKHLYLSCDYVDKMKWIVCGLGNGYNAMYIYKVNDDNSISRIDLNNIVKGTSDDTKFFDITDEDYITYTGSVLLDDVDYYGLHQTSTHFIKTYIDNGTLYINSMFGNYFRFKDGTNTRSMVFNLLYKIDISNEESSYDVSYENKLPLSYNIADGTNESDDTYSIYSLHSNKQIKPYIFPGKTKILLPVVKELDKGILIEEYGDFSNYLDFAKGINGGLGSGVKKVDGNSAYLGYKVYFPYDASYLGKSLGYTIFLGPKVLLTNSYSYLYGTSGGVTNRLKTYLSNDELKSNVPFNLYNPPKMLSGTVVPYKIELANDYSLFKQTFLTQDGDINAYYEKDGEIYKTQNGGAISNIKTLPSNYIDTIENDISNDPEYTDSEEGDPDNESYEIKIINDDYLLVTYVLEYAKSDGLNKFKYNWILYDISGSNFDLKKRGSVLEYEPSIFYTIMGVYADFNLSTAYLDKNNDLYMWVGDPYIKKAGATHKKYTLIKLDSNLNVLENDFFTYHWMYERFSIGIHPLYGPYKTESARDLESKSRFGYVDHRDESDLDTRITECFEDMINASDSLKNGKWHDSLMFGNESSMLTVRQAEGFIIYSDESPIFINGLYTQLNINSYDLTEPQYGLVESTGSTDELKNKMIYIYINTNEDLVSPSLSFSFSEPTDPILAIATTDDYGIVNIIVKDGLEITASTTYVKKINILNDIEMKGEDGNWYRIYIDKDGNLDVALLN